MKKKRKSTMATALLAAVLLVFNAVMIPAISIAEENKLEEKTAFKVTIEETCGGEVCFREGGEGEFARGSKVVLVIGEEEGFTFDEVSITSQSGSVPASVQGSLISFEMPGEPVQVRANFKESNNVDANEPEDRTSGNQNNIDTKTTEKKADIEQSVPDKSTAEPEDENQDAASIINEARTSGLLSVENNEKGGELLFKTQSKKTVHISYGKKLYYSNYSMDGHSLGSGAWTRKFHVEGSGIDSFAYCVQPPKSPASGNVSVDVVNLSDGGTLGKIMYYAGDASDEDNFFDKKYKNSSDTARIIVTHIALSKKYNSSQNWSWGASNTAIRIANELISYAQKMPSPVTNPLRMSTSSFRPSSTSQHTYYSTSEKKVMQKTNTIKLRGDHSEKISFYLPKNVKMVRIEDNGDKKFFAGGKTVKVYGGQKFYFTAPWNITKLSSYFSKSKNCTYSVKAKGTSLADYTAKLLKISGYQSFVTISDYKDTVLDFKISFYEPSRLRVKKTSSDADIVSNLSGAEFRVYRTLDDAKKGTNYYSTVLTTRKDSEGYYTTPWFGVCIPGNDKTYYVRERKAPRGCKLKSGKIFKINLKAGATTTISANTLNIENEVIYKPKILLKKVNEFGNAVNGNAKTVGTRFRIDYFKDTATVKYTTPASIQGVTPTRTFIFATAQEDAADKNSDSIIMWDKDYLDKTSPSTDLSITSGYLRIVEITAGEGFIKDDTPQYTRTETSGTDAPTFGNRTISSLGIENNEIKGNIELWKYDKELKNSETLNRSADSDSDLIMPSLSGVEFDIINRSSGTVEWYGNSDSSKAGDDEDEEGGDDEQENDEIDEGSNDGEEGIDGSEAEDTADDEELTEDLVVAAGRDGTYAPGEKIATIKTTYDKDRKKYIAAIKGLPYGKYEVRETASSAGYLLSDVKSRTIEIKEDGKTYSPETNPELIFSNRIARGDINFVKVRHNRKDKKTPVSAAFKLTCLATGESHIIVTGKDGIFDSAASPHAENVNINDTLLREYGDGKKVIPADELSLESGTWFGKGKEGTESVPDNSLGAFPYGEYEYTELPTEDTYGAVMVSGFFTVSIDGENQALGTQGEITDEDIEICTSAKGSETDDHIAMAREKTIIKDSVKINNLRKGFSYTISGILMDKVEGRPVKDPETGEEVTSRITFTVPLDEESGETKGDLIEGDYLAELLFEFNAEKLANHDVVVFERLFDENSTLIADHSDIKDEEQTVHFPEIQTSATDENTGLSVIDSQKDITLTDTVEYKNLIPDKEYTVTGILMDKETGQPVCDENNRKITAETAFVPETADGTTEVVFCFKGVNLAGKTCVVFENLEYKGISVAVHADINDEKQTVYFPSIGTSAKDGETGMQLSNADSEIIIVDTVNYASLKPNKKYRISGVIMDSNTGKPLLDDNGHEITSYMNFIPETTDGRIDVIFKLKGTSLAGRTAVVFEELFSDNVQLAEHRDIRDTGQTIYFPAISTFARDKDSGKKVIRSNSATVVDTVAYKNLIPNREYKLYAELIDKTSGKTVAKGEKAFKADKSKGRTDVEIKFAKAYKYSGKDLVVYEKLTANDKPVAYHREKNSKAQSVSVEITDCAVTTGDRTNLLLIVCIFTDAMLLLAIYACRRLRRS